MEAEEKGMAKGKAEGMAKGKAEGKAEGMKAVAISMIKEGDSLEKISRITGLSEEKIMVLKGEELSRKA